MAYIGKGLSGANALRTRYFYTAAGGETSLSGADDNGLSLSFTDGNYIDVYLNGILLVAGDDYNTTTANTVAGLTALVASDIVEIVVYETFSLFNSTISGNLTVTEDLTVDTDTLYVDSTNNRVGIGTSSPVSQLDVAGVIPTLTIQDTQNKSWTSADTTLGELAFRTRDPSGIGAHNIAFVRAVNEVTSSTTPSGALTFGISLSNNNASEAMRIDSSGNVGIGTTSPIAKFDVKNGTNQHIISSSASAYGDNALVGVNDSGSEVGLGLAGSQVEIYTGATERMRIDSSGNVGIGNTSPESLANYHFLDVGSSGTKRGVIQAYDGTTKASMWVTNDAIANFGTRTDHPMTLRVNGSEKVRIDSSGNVHIGTTAAGSYPKNGHSIRGGDSAIFSRNSTGETMQVRRAASNGEWIRFYEGSSTIVGDIRRAASDILAIGAGSAKVSFNDGSNQFYPGGTDGTGTDNHLSLGKSNARWTQLFAATTTISTSDNNEKQQVTDLTAAELAVAKRLSVLIKTFKFNDAVTDKGSNARKHVGLIAQDVNAAFTAEGLNASDYAMWCSDTWWETQTEVPAVEADEENGIEAQDAYTRTDTYDTEEEAPEGATSVTRLGVRYEQIHSFIIDAFENRIADLETKATDFETRIAALEAN